jgi:hypothetical protein
MRTKASRPPHQSYVSICSGLKMFADKVGLTARPASKEMGVRESELRASQELAGIDVPFQTMVAAAKAALVISSAVLTIVVVILVMFTGTRFIVPMAFLLVVVPLLSREVILAYPHGAARKRAVSVLKGSPESVSLMVMSLRHEPSLSKAIRFAARRENAYSRELRGCIWSVVMGVHSNFEDSLHALGVRWSKYSDELKDSLNAMVTASCESTDDGKRRALDRANMAMVSGTKRRIEEYALSLSAPSMIMFGLGILLPLMVGSFLPMLSWNLWSMDGPGVHDLDSADGPQSMFQTMFLMNVLFPSIAVLVAMNAISRHPLETGKGGRKRLPKHHSAWFGVAVASTLLGCLTVALLARGQFKYVLFLIAAVSPIALWLMAGRGPGTGREASVGLEDALFKTGARMLDGGNFESALNRASDDLDRASCGLVRRLSFITNAVGRDFDEAADSDAMSTSESNALEGLRVVKEAASKDELAAGMLAMDLATYLRDLRELETTLRNRLRPTISMMKMTIYALGPIVLGVTYAIYLALTSMVDGGQVGARAGSFFLVLGLFLAETDAVVSYFVWGIEGKRGRGELMYSIGACVLISELIYAATATLAS